MDKGCDQPHLGLATSDELMAELETRFRLDNRTDLASAVDTLRDRVPLDMRRYRTVDPEAGLVRELRSDYAGD